MTERHVPHFLEELEQLKARLLEMGGLAEDRLRLAVSGLVDRDLSALRRCSWGAAPASTTLLRAMIDAFPQADIVTAFGQTECSPVTCLLRGDDAIRKIGSIGRPIVNVEARIVDAEMNDGPRGGAG